MTGAGGPRIDGECDARFGAVADAFRDNFSERDELGASLCVTVDGKTVVDLWGGHADAARTRVWHADTLVNVFSIGKGLVALAVVDGVSRGLIAYDAPVTTYWPEFAANDKGAVTVAELLAHRAGLPAFHDRMPAGIFYDWDATAAALAAEPPWWEPGTAHGYHVNTFGFLAGEVLRRATGRTVGAFVRERLAHALGADVHIGLPTGEHDRVAECIFLPELGEPPPEADPEHIPPAARMRFNAYFNPSGLSGAGLVNTAVWREAELPSTNMHATARGVARVYTAIVNERIVEPAVLADATTERSCGDDLVLERPSRFGLGFQLTQPERPLGPNAGAFGHFGAGGALGFCDPEARLAFGYVMNRMAPGWQSPRNRALIDALYSSLG